MNKLSFEWDKKKSLSNKKKHGVSFEEAQTVFYDENAFEFYDDDHSEKEERFLMVGLSLKLRVLITSYCIREKGNIIRIISARKTTKKESQFYWKERS